MLDFAPLAIAPLGQSVLALRIEPSISIISRGTESFENSVPRQIGSRFKASAGLGPIDVGAAESSDRSSGSATDRAVSAAQGAAPTAEMKAPTLLAVARHRGTEISNPFSSSGEWDEPPNPAAAEGDFWKCVRPNSR